MLWHRLTVVLILVSTHVHCKRKNVLFLVADDMRPDLDVYQGRDSPSPVREKVHAPNLNSLAGKSLLLRRAYVQQSVCSPSRTSLLTGRRPDTTHVYDLHTYWRKAAGNFTTLPEYFKRHGYNTLGFGKIFHPGGASGDNDPLSWSEPCYETRPKVNSFADDGNSWRAVPTSLLNSNSLQDTVTTDMAIQKLKSIAPKARSGQEPFFLAVGYHKPHLPFVFPEKFLSYYPDQSIHVPPNQYAPLDMPSLAWITYPELRHYKDIAALNATGAPNTTLPANVVKNLRRAYYSCISYIDEELGRVLAELEHQGLANDTIISFFGDHGWQLG
ncbi:iduronate 2-sulfatase-like [Haliotis rufescens]|uniref:iduronate 2-sulfatase-like n=1 Tax=Haliotis rufescens TaxID=6454 RepID=UPI00201F081A|nr:iduronate 2-sulfatase-like [Haliotis rufescens]